MTLLTRRATLLALAALPTGMPVQAQDWPNRPLRIIAPYTPGGGIDTTARLLAGPMSTLLGQPVVVENRPGSSGMIGAAEAARAAADGHTLLVDALPHVAKSDGDAQPTLRLCQRLRAGHARGDHPHILIVPLSLPVRNVPELVELAKARPGQLPYGTPGSFTGSHVAAVLLANRAGLELIHVPYRGGRQRCRI